MAIFNRIYCSNCKAGYNLCKKNERKRTLICKKCLSEINVTAQKNYYIEYYADNRRIRERIGTSKELAENVLRKREIEIAENKFLDVRNNEPIRFEDFAKEYLQLHAKVNNKTWDTFCTSMISTLNQFFQGKYLHEITPHLIEKFKAERAQSVTPATINRNLACLSSIFNKAITWKRFHGENPVKFIKFFKENNQRLRYLERDEILKLLVCCDTKLRSIVVIALNTGMRRGEILNIKWQDINLQLGIIYLYQTKNNERREIPINDKVKSALLDVNRHPHSEYVFCKRDGSAIRDIKKSLKNHSRQL